jgi:hypothetical protein
LEDVGILQIIYSLALSQRAIVDPRTFLETGLAEKIMPIQPKEVGGFEVFLYEAAQNFELFSNIQD